MATCIRCGTQKLTERPCPKCGGMENGANQEMIDGYFDGRDAFSPEPSGNRSFSYRHGFANGRDDLNGSPRDTAENLRRMADDAMALDDGPSTTMLP